MSDHERDQDHDGDEDLRLLLHDAVSDVRPSPGLDAIRARTGGGATTTSSRRWAPLVVAVAAAVAVVTGGTAWVAQRMDDQDATGHTAAAQHPRSTVGAAATQDVLPAHSTDVTVYYVGETASGPRLFSERHHLTGVTTSDLQAAVQAAASRPPHDDDYYPFPAGDGVAVTATQDADGITVDLGRWTQPQDAGAGEDQQLALQALIWTADAATGTTLPVRFLVDGRAADGVLSTDTTQPVAPLDADAALATVSISSPTQGEEVGQTFDVTGQAATFEANVVWELKKDGHVVQHGFTTASECCTLSPYSFTVKADPGSYTLVVHDTDESDGEGVGTAEDTKAITVR